MYDTLKFFHILFVFLWVGGSVIGITLAFRAATANPVHRLGIARHMRFAGDRVFAPASMLALIFGIAMVLTRDAYGFGDLWILIGFGGLVVSSAIGGIFFSPKTKALVAELEGGGGGDALLRTIARVGVLDLLVLFIVVWAMIIKPGA